MAGNELCRAACCNLSEAFETNAAVDASFTDAVTGTKQIRMLGLDGKYTQIMFDNMPGARGLNILQGMKFIPGEWVDQIHIGKGAGSVTLGHESMTGQINVALRNADGPERLIVNAFGNRAGRLELNTISRHAVSRKWNAALLTHGEWADRINDRNGDGFQDNALSKDVVLQVRLEIRRRPRLARRVRCDSRFAGKGGGPIADVRFRGVRIVDGQPAGGPTGGFSENGLRVFLEMRGAVWAAR